MQQRVISISVTPDGVIEVTFANGETVLARLRQLVDRGGPYADLNDIAFAAQALILDEGLLVKWPSGFALTAEELYAALKDGGGAGTIRMF